MKRNRTCHRYVTNYWRRGQRKKPRVKAWPHPVAGDVGS
jgi:hypothetical protein